MIAFSEIIEKIFRVYENKNKYYPNKTKEKLRTENENMFDLYKKVKNLEIPECLKRLVYQEVIIELNQGFEDFGPKAYKVFVDLMNLGDEWTTPKEKTGWMFCYFYDYLTFECRKIIFETNNGYYELLKGKSEEDVKKYIKECYRIVNIGKQVEDNFIFDIGLSFLCDIYIYFYKKPVEAIKFAKQMINPDVFLNRCYHEIIKIQKAKHNFNKW